MPDPRARLYSSRHPYVTCVLLYSLVGDILLGFWDDCASKASMSVSFVEFVM